MVAAIPDCIPGVIRNVTVMELNHRKLIKGSVRRATINVTHVLLVLMDVIVEMDHRGA